MDNQLEKNMEHGMGLYRVLYIYINTHVYMHIYTVCSEEMLFSLTRKSRTL